MNATDMDSLIGILEQEARIYDSLLRISRDKTSIIIENKISELDKLTRLEQSLILQMGRLEAQREKLVENLAAELGLNPSGVTASELVRHLDEQQARRLKEYQAGMNETLNTLRDANELNARLIHNSLEYINFSINLLTAVDGGSNNYGSTGEISSGKKRNFLDVKL